MPLNLPAATLDMCRSDAVLLAAIGGYKWDLPRHLRPESGLLGLRVAGAVANLRPANITPANASSLKRVVEGVDIMVVRELTGGIYFGQPKGIFYGDW